MHSCRIFDKLKNKNEFTLGKLSHLMTDVNISWRFCQVLCALNFASLMHEKNINRKCSIFDFLLKKLFFFSMCLKTWSTNWMEWKSSMKNKNGNNKTTKIITIEKKKFSIFAFFLKNTIIHVCRKKNYFRRSCNKTSKTFLKIVQKSLIFSKNIIFALKFKYL